MIELSFKYLIRDEAILVMKNGFFLKINGHREKIHPSNELLYIYF